MTNKELGIKIRKVLKDKGYSNRDISVKVRDSLYDTAVYLTIKNPKIRKSEIKAIVNKFKEVDYDERTGEVLAGGNTYVFCRYESGIFNDAEAQYLPLAEEILNTHDWHDGRKLLENEDREIYMFNTCKYEQELHEFYKSDISDIRPSKRVVITCAEDLSVALWRFENVGTIYA